MSSNEQTGQALPLARLLTHTAEALAAVAQGRSLSDVLPKVPAPARAGTQALSFAALRRLGSARAALQILATRRPAASVEALLQVALALLWPGDEAMYADHTLVDQAVEAARKLSPASAGFVNAVLRRFLRERQELASTLSTQSEAVWNHPIWWVDALRRDWPDDWQALLGHAQQHPPMALRVNRRQIQRDEYLSQLQAAGLAASLPCADPALAALAHWLPDAVLLEKPCPVERLPGFAQGWVSVQDVSAQLAAALLLGTAGSDLPPLPAGARVLDACAAPGGKTAHLLEATELNLLALDSDASRLRRVDENLKRLSLKAATRAADASRVQDWWDGELFDAILLDAPCSASGIVRRHPDIRWLRRRSDIAALAKTQAALLDALWPILKPGGRLLYATCSLFKAEGEARVAAFLQRWPESAVRLASHSPGHLLPVPHNPLQADLSAEDSPHQLTGSQVDGFFYCLLHKSMH